MFRRFALAAVMLAGMGIPSRPAVAQGSARAFSIFFDCSDFYCETDFYRTDIDFVDHVRERTAADVHVLITRQSTGGGGGVFTLAFYGQRRFAGISDTTSVTSAQGATEDELRRTISRAVKLGLGRYLARTPEAARALLTVAAPAADAPSTGPTRDPWNAWVFRIGANLNGSREHDFSNNYVNGSLNASRVTEDWKSSFRLSENYNDQSFTIGGDKVTSVTRNYGATMQQVKSLGQHWSAGFNAGAASSTYLNQHLGVTVSPTVEYDVFPYKDFTRQALTFQYSVGVKHFRYDDTTVYFKKVETKPYQSLDVTLAQKQTWGSIRLGISGYHYLNDISKSRLTFFPEADVRLFKGFSINMFANYSVLHDQLYLPKGNLTREEVLLRQSQLATTYRAFIYMGINYTFGSVLNNVVNPRFGNNNNDF